MVIAYNLCKNQLVSVHSNSEFPEEKNKLVLLKKGKINLFDSWKILECL